MSVYLRAGNVEDDNQKDLGISRISVNSVDVSSRGLSSPEIPGQESPASEPTRTRFRKDGRRKSSRINVKSDPAEPNGSTVLSEVPIAAKSNDKRPLYSRSTNSRYIHPQDQWVTVAEAFNKYDIHVVQTGKEYIDSLFAPAGLFAAILSAFNIVSYSLLQSDPSQSTPVILAQISQQLATMSLNADSITSISGPYVPPAPFRASIAVIIINVCWFSSLVLSLTFVSVGSLVRQWLQEYEALTSSQAYESVCIRQYRYNGFVHWRVSAIMKVLPLLLQSALLLFFAGMLVLLWTVNNIVAGVVSVFVALWLIFLLFTIILPTIHKDCPYKSAEASVFFTLVQFIKTSLHPFVHYICMHSDLPRSLETFFWTLKDMSRTRYENWRAREKDLIKNHLTRLSQQIISFVDEALMDESILGTIVRLYVNNTEHGYECVGRILGLLEHAADKDSASLKDWKPVNSRHVRALMHSVLEVLKKANPPFLQIEQEVGGEKEEDRDPMIYQQEGCELLMVVLASYTWENAGDELALEVFQDIVDLPIQVNLLGLGCGTLREFLGAMWRAEETDIDVQAVNHLSQCIVYCRGTERWVPSNADDFIWACIYSIRLVARLPLDDFIPPEKCLPHFTSMLNSLGELFIAVRTGELELSTIDTLICVCEEMRDLASTHPELHPYMKTCVIALIDIHRHPPTGLYSPHYGISYTRKRHLTWLTELCNLYAIPYPRSFPLLDMPDVLRLQSKLNLGGDEGMGSPDFKLSETDAMDAMEDLGIDDGSEQLVGAASGDVILQMEEILQVERDAMQASDLVRKT